MLRYLHPSHKSLNTWAFKGMNYSSTYETTESFNCDNITDMQFAVYLLFGFSEHLSPLTDNAFNRVDFLNWNHCFQLKMSVFKLASK